MKYALLSLLIFIWILPGTAGGTLVVIVPAANGVVVAADSRVVFPRSGLVCDDEYKIVEVRRPLRTVIVATGEVGGDEQANVDPANPCHRSEHTSSKGYDIPSLAKAYVETNGATTTAIDMKGLGQKCASAISKYWNFLPPALKHIPKDGVFFTVALISYAPSSKITSISTFKVAWDNAGRRIIPTNFDREDYLLGEPSSYSAIGEGAYLQNSVINGVGKQYLSFRSLSFIDHQIPLSMVSKDQAAAVATDLIEAASRTTNIISIPNSGIGGPIDVLFMGESEKSERIRWKPHGTYH